MNLRFEVTSSFYKNKIFQKTILFYDYFNEWISHNNILYIVWYVTCGDMFRIECILCLFFCSVYHSFHFVHLLQCLVVSISDVILYMNKNSICSINDNVYSKEWSGLHWLMAVFRNIHTHTHTLFLLLFFFTQQIFIWYSMDCVIVVWHFGSFHRIIIISSVGYYIILIRDYVLWHENNLYI